MTKFCWNQSEIFWEIDVFVRSLHANFDQNRLNVKKFAKNRVLKKTAQKISIDAKWQALQNGYLEISKFWVFDPQNFKKRYFWENPNEIQNFQNFEKTGIYVIEPHVDYQHAKF